MGRKERKKGRHRKNLMGQKRKAVCYWQPYTTQHEKVSLGKTLWAMTDAKGNLLIFQDSFTGQCPERGKWAGAVCATNGIAYWLKLCKEILFSFLVTLTNKMQTKPTLKLFWQSAFLRNVCACCYFGYPTVLSSVKYNSQQTFSK